MKKKIRAFNAENGFQECDFVVENSTDPQKKISYHVKNLKNVFKTMQDLKAHVQRLIDFIKQTTKEEDLKKYTKYD